MLRRVLHEERPFHPSFVSSSYYGGNYQVLELKMFAKAMPSFVTYLYYSASKQELLPYKILLLLCVCHSFL